LLADDGTGAHAASGVDGIDGQDTGGCYRTPGGVWCWGVADYEAALGNGSSIGDLARPVERDPTGTLGPMNGVFLLDQTAISIDATDHWFGWGADLQGELLIAPPPPPQPPLQRRAAALPMITLSNPATVATGQHHACAIVGTQVWCWGRNDRGQSDPTASSAPIAPRVVSVGAVHATELSLGRSHSCALIETNLVCWGDLAEMAPAGDAATCPSNICPPLVVSSSSPGWRHLPPVRNAGDRCAIDTNDRLWCWGDGYATAGGTPAMIDQLPAVRTSAISWEHGCAITTQSEIWCWGHDDHGQLGRGSIAPDDTTIYSAARVVWR
jgi:alpha-tubulin suppressor-like RCC1 family protein